MSFVAVTRLTDAVDLTEFRCGEASIDTWLQRSALRNERKGFSRTFITLDDSDRLAGFHSLSGFALDRRQVGALGRGAPDPVPAILLGRLAVHERHHGKGLGASLLQDAALRSITVAKTAGIALMVVHATAGAVGFYERFGFRPLRDEPLTLIASIDRLAASLAAARA